MALQNFAYSLKTKKKVISIAVTHLLRRSTVQIKWTSLQVLDGVNPAHKINKSQEVSWVLQMKPLMLNPHLILIK